MTFTPEQLAMQPPGAILDWWIFDDGFIADDYRIVLLGPAQWEVRRSADVVGIYRSLKTAFVSAEHHHRESIRQGLLRRNGIAFALAVIAWFAVDVVFGVTGAGFTVLVLFPIVFIGMRSMARFLASLSGNINNPYLSVPYKLRRPWWQRWRRW